MGDVEERLFFIAKMIVLPGQMIDKMGLNFDKCLYFNDMFKVEVDVYAKKI